MREVWKDIKNYEGLYQVSNLGRIKSLERTVNVYGGRSYIKGEKILRTVYDKNGYKLITLYDNGEKTMYRVHRLVADAFLDNINSLPIINHKDENKSNNKVDNLEWCTYKYNSNYGGGVAKMVKNRDLREKILNQQKKIKMISKNGELINMFNSIKEASLYTKVNMANICRCCGGFLKSAGGFKWEYV